MTLEELTAKYIRNSERVLMEMKMAQEVGVIADEKIKGIVDSAKRYLNDAKYYKERNKLETSLASVAYCEGLLDALRLLGLVEFTWQSEKEK